MNVTVTPSSRAVQLSPDRWLMSIPEGANNHYRLAQIDDYQDKNRSSFPWNPPLTLSLKAKTSMVNIPGTWGFGFWNDPFRFSIKIAQARFRFPTLPNAIWYIFASSESYLSLNTQSQANGQLATTYRSLNINPCIFGPAAFLLPLAALPPVGKGLRKIGQYFIKQDGKSIDHDSSKFHHYQIDWKRNEATFYLDGAEIFHSSIVPIGPLGLVIWIDNQFAAFPPNGKIKFGTLANHQSVSVEIQDIKIFPLAR